MSLGIVRSARVPLLREPAVARLAKMAETVLATGVDAPEMEAAIARTYGLTREEFAELVTHFPKLDDEKRDAMLASSLWPRHRRK
jgi:hypothetical protein